MKINKLKKMHEEKIEKNLKKLAKSSLFVFLGVILSKLLTYMYRIIIVRAWGAEIYGIYSIAIMVLGIVVAISSLGLIEGLLRFIPVYRAKNKDCQIKIATDYVRKILLFSGIISSLILFYLSDYISNNLFHDNSLTPFLKIFSFVLFIQIFTNFYFSIIRANEKIRANSFGTNILQNLSRCIFLIFFIIFGIGSFVALTGSYFLGILSGLIFSLYYYKRNIQKIHLKKSNCILNVRSIKKEILGYSWPLVFSGVMINLFYWSDTFLLGIFMKTSEVGIYNMATPLALLILFSAEMFIQLFFPLITREITSKNYNLIKELSKQVTKWALLISIPLSCLIFLFAEKIIYSFFGKGYFSAVPILRILIFGQLFYSLGLISNNLLLARGKSKLVLTNLSIMALFNIILNYILIPKYGLIGAAIATSTSLIILSLILIVENYIVNSFIILRRKLIKVIVSSAISLLIVYILNFNLNVPSELFFSVSLFILSYIILVFLTRALDKNDLSILRLFIMKRRYFIQNTESPI